MRGDAGWTVVGTGRVGTALARWLAQTGAAPLACIRHAGLASWLARLPQQAPAGVLLAVPDDALPELARRLAAAHRDWRGWCVLHTSGTRPAAVLAPLARRGAATASLHPMMTFAGRAVSPTGVIFSIEGSAKACQAARRLVRRWGGQSLPLAPAAKASYHLAATLVGPGTVVNMAAAEALLRRSGFAGARLGLARAGLLRLLQATTANLASGPEAAWTGAWARGDRTTLALHRRQLPNRPLRHLYDGLAGAASCYLPTSTVSRAREN
ncbi:MAG: DUF2520 domain-containing protein [Terriglobales bacterium]